MFTARTSLTAIGASLATALVLPAMSASAGTTPEHHRDPAATVASLDTKYQAAVKNNDVATIDRILADDFVIVTGRGSVFTKEDVLNDARTQACTYEKQDEMPGTQKVRVFGQHTATVTALLWIKGSCSDGSTVDQKLWFSDTYVLRQGQWRYTFGQSSIHL
ncbi:nuclear transport factor 2 family protein [Fodinicola acaciae]|uniref:nuclear transport factor 2 family protein n=1 Tax=Fodinicola acaciae TaxID=2681555 RepID=UPI0013D44A72|nr:nuclear transport factor 2 family protein [Fodinicola acaciae]